jgi:hypothetical protein
MKLKLIIAVFAVFVLNVKAQTNEANYIPFDSKGNVIELLINNQTSENLKQVKIKAIEYPDWVKIANKEVIMNELKRHQKNTARFIFDIDKSAPVDSSAKISFRIDDKTGKSYVRNINFVVSAPVDFELFQNYPNPFNPSTSIKYSIPKSVLVTLKIYDVLGKEITTLVNEKEEAGLHKIEFNPTNLSSGVYFYTLKTEGFLQTKKMILIR